MGIVSFWPPSIFFWLWLIYELPEAAAGDYSVVRVGLTKLGLNLDYERRKTMNLEIWHSFASLDFSPGMAIVAYLESN